MGQLFREVGEFVESASNEIWVEIGSDRWEGSSIFLAHLAQPHGIPLHSIDIDSLASQRIQHPNIHWHVMDGETWCHEVLPALDKKIGLVYFDNFDYTWDINAWNDSIRDQRRSYKEKYNIEMNNRNCQLAHLRQLLAVEPYLSESATVLCDDTYTLNDCWVGKGGGIVLYLLSRGWTIVREKDFGVILKRCKK